MNHYHLDVLYIDCLLNSDLGVTFLLVMEFRPQGRVEEKIKIQVFVKSQDKIFNRQREIQLARKRV